ncbi:MAG TPA: gluconokinase [Dyella sp.]|uniref:gluconokinase n=1 Tax=Dyella sp. TaxID=1869338 RepID=UPI002CAE0E71|nr:gluconokinase [Dyella sp.]HUB91852.1 gluconokinase [Dyella sp.]
MRAIVVMGVTGCGKSTVATAICQRTGAYLIEGDEFHPPENIRKMRAGIPLTDADRQGWLERLAREAADRLASYERVVLTCSALKQRYRDTLRQAAPALGFVFLALTPEQATQRVAHRAAHFMPASLVDSQFRDLEVPDGEPLVFAVDATRPVDVIAEEVVAWWHAGWGKV